MTTAKVVELVGCSDKGFEDAILNAFNDAKKTTRGISGLDVVKFSAKVRDDAIVEFRANVKISFLVER
jgi:flavin-binding protein dodecin